MLPAAFPLGLSVPEACAFLLVPASFSRFLPQPGFQLIITAVGGPDSWPPKQTGPPVPSCLPYSPWQHSGSLQWHYLCTLDGQVLELKEGVCLAHHILQLCIFTTCSCTWHMVGVTETFIKWILNARWQGTGRRCVSGEKGAPEPLQFLRLITWGKPPIRVIWGLLQGVAWEHFVLHKPHIS